MKANNKIVLIGQSDSKRTEYFFKAAKTLNIPIDFYKIDEELPNFSKQTCLKIDPPKYQESNILKANKMVENYMNFLEQISPQEGLCFLNHPKAILNTLDKKICKEILLSKKILTTPWINEEINNIQELRKYLIENKIYSIFIKPRYGSGAAGVIAYRLHPKTNQEIIYTSIKEKNRQLINTKKIIKINEKDKIESIVNAILSNEYILEKWIPKPQINGVNYDIRVVYQFGKIIFMVARGSKTPITNLHLNNNAIQIENLNLSTDVINRIQEVCSKAMSAFKGLNYAGIDLLLKGKTLEPVIIEINGQGDLIYKDIFDENRIYKEQIIRMIKHEN